MNPQCPDPMCVDGVLTLALGAKGVCPHRVHSEAIKRRAAEAIAEVHATPAAEPCTWRGCSQNAVATHKVESGPVCNAHGEAWWKQHGGSPFDALFPDDPEPTAESADYQELTELDKALALAQAGIDSRPTQDLLNMALAEINRLRTLKGDTPDD